jgi:hypothetical protein
MKTLNLTILVLASILWGVLMGATFIAVKASGEVQTIKNKITDDYNVCSIDSEEENGYCLTQNEIDLIFK